MCASQVRQRGPKSDGPVWHGGYMTASALFSLAISPQGIGNHIRKLEGVRHPAASPEALEAAADYVAETLTSYGYPTTPQWFTERGRRYRNIIATKKGYGTPQQQILLVAHYDTVATSPGADDNASGVAVLLEVAAALIPLKFERTIRFIGLNLEENRDENAPDSGTRGSRALANHAASEGWELEGVVVLESVAFAGDDVVQGAPSGLPFPAPDYGNFIAVVGNERSRGLVEGFTRGAAGALPPLPCLPLVVPGNGESLPDTRRSDHAPFWDKGYRGIMVTDTTNFRNPHYHRESDTLETLNLGFAAQVGSVTAALIAHMAGMYWRTG